MLAENYDPAEIFEQLKKCQVEYFDFYLLHNVYENSVHIYEDPHWGIVDYFIEQKKRGRIKHLGFSGHADLPCLTEFLDRYGSEMEFCQLQFNFLDWTMQHGKEKYELQQQCIPLWVMEPVRLSPDHGRTSQAYILCEPQDCSAAYEGAGFGLPCPNEEVSLQTGTDRISGLLQQPQDQGKAKGLAACNSQTASPLGCLNNFDFKILSNFGGSLHYGLSFYLEKSRRVRAAAAARKRSNPFFAAACTSQKTPCAGLGPKELASADPTVDVGPECIFACNARKNARFGARALQKRCTFFEELKTRIPRRRRRLRG